MKKNICEGRGCFDLADEPAEKINCSRGCFKLDSYNWLQNISGSEKTTDIAEIRFKNTRKGYYQNVNKLNLVIGDIVAVEASPGHDIGIVAMTGELVLYQLKKSGVSVEDNEFKKIYRKAKPTDIDKWREAIKKEHSTMIEARKIAEQQKLEMKIGDVEYQGDCTKAIFYYIADDRVDFRELIKIFAEKFKVRIEMKQIGARQEAGRIGGIGTCGRELCCSGYITNFVSVTTSVARYQGLSLNPQKLAGQCGKLKCCLNYELDVYLDALEEFPDVSIPLKTKKGDAVHQKTDVFKKLMWYAYKEGEDSKIICMSLDSVKEIIEMNKKNRIPEKLVGVEIHEPDTISSLIDYQKEEDLESLSQYEDRPSNNNKKERKQKKPYKKHRR